MAPFETDRLHLADGSLETQTKPESAEGPSSMIRLEVDAAMKAKWEASKAKIVAAQD